VGGGLILIIPSIFLPYYTHRFFALPAAWHFLESLGVALLLLLLLLALCDLSVLLCFVFCFVFSFFASKRHYVSF